MGTNNRPGRCDDVAAPATIDELLHEALAAWGTDPTRFDSVLDELSLRMEQATTEAEAMFEPVADRLWEQGWTPADLVHVVVGQLSAGHGEVAGELLVADGQRRQQAGHDLHPRWQQELDAIDRATNQATPHQRLRRVIEVSALSARLMSIPETIPPPGRLGAGAALHGTNLEPRMLARVRALLAKAESSTFEEEAAAFTAKAQELISRHAIDEALLHTVDDVGEPSVRRMYIDAPYASAKANLFAEVAGANRGRLVYSEGLGWVTAFGYDHDLDAVELLTSSLLAQATGTMARHGSRRDAAGRSRTRSFRRAFLLGFAQRIGERLRSATDDQVATASGKGGLPVLAARDDRLRRAQHDAFPELVRRSVTASNATGYSAGRAAATVADLDPSRAGPSLP